MQPKCVPGSLLVWKSVSGDIFESSIPVAFKKQPASYLSAASVSGSRLRSALDAELAWAGLQKAGPLVLWHLTKAPLLFISIPLPSRMPSGNLAGQSRGPTLCSCLPVSTPFPSSTPCQDFSSLYSRHSTDPSRSPGSASGKPLCRRGESESLA